MGPGMRYPTRGKLCIEVLEATGYTYEVLEESDTTRDVNLRFVCDKHLLTIVLITSMLLLHDYMNDQ